MADYYEWFDPHQKRTIADAAPAKERHAFDRGMNAGQSQMTQLLRSGVLDGLQMGAKELGRKVPNQPEFLEAVEKVTQSVLQNHDYRVSIKSEPHSMANMVFQEVNVRPFRVQMGVRFSEQDLWERRWA
jgi:hypothetical protein